MNTPSASRAESPTVPAGLDVGAAPTAPSAKVLVWDAPVRVFHWLMVACFAGAWLSAESERWRLLHVTLGYTMVGLVVFRLVWGLVGTRHARFASFVRGPAAVRRYFEAILQKRPEHHTGHNPAGALAILALLGLTLLIGATGWANYNEIGGDRVAELHELAANSMVALIGLHIAAVVLSSWLHGENLVSAMVSGRKPGRPEDGVRKAWASVAALMLVVVLGFWFVQWQGRYVAAAKDAGADRPAAQLARRDGATGAPSGKADVGGGEARRPRDADD
jgi:cytochrome b